MTTPTKKELTQEEINEMDSKSHENDVKPAPTFKLASLKLNGKEGNFFKTIIENGEMKLNEDNRAMLEDMGAKIKGVILRARVQFAANETDMEIYTSEGDKGGKFNVFVKTEKEKGGFMTQYAFTGNADQIKARYPELKYIQILYFLLEDTNEIVRLKVKGMSLGNLFDYFKEFSRNEHIWQYVSEFGFAHSKNKFGKFFVSTIKRGKKVEDFSEVQTAIREVNDKLQDIEDYYQEKDEQRMMNGEVPIEEAPAQQNDAQTGEEAPKGVDDGELPKAPATDEIDVKGIPFDNKESEGDPSDEELKKAGL